MTEELKSFKNLLQAFNKRNLESMSNDKAKLRNPRVSQSEPLNIKPCEGVGESYNIFNSPKGTTMLPPIPNLHNDIINEPLKLSMVKRRPSQIIPDSFDGFIPGILNAVDEFSSVNPKDNLVDIRIVEGVVVAGDLSISRYKALPLRGQVIQQQKQDLISKIYDTLTPRNRFPIFRDIIDFDDSSLYSKYLRGVGLGSIFYDELSMVYSDLYNEWPQSNIDESIKAVKRYDYIHTFIHLVLGSTGIIIIDSLTSKPIVDLSVLEKDTTDYRIISYKELYEEQTRHWYGGYSIGEYPSYTFYSSYEKYIDKGQSNKPKINNRGRIKKINYMR